MSRWKEESVKIIQMVPKLLTGYNATYSVIDGTVGLGSDSKLYVWAEKEGKWEKGWDYNNE